MQGGSSSPELFESLSPTTDESSNITDDSKSNEVWRGTSMKDVLNDGNPWKYYTTPINPSRNHTVLFELPVTLSSPPKPHYSSNTCHWDNNHVKMPFSHKNLYPVKNGDEETVRPRWELIQCALLRTISTSTELEKAIFSYNLRHSKLYALHYFCEEILSEDESQYFFNDLLPKIIQLALQLPELIPTPIPLLKQGKSHSISLSQLQIACLLANAFLCTFPWRKEMAEYPGINFNRLFECLADANDNAIFEKIKCLMHYFRRVCNNVPCGVVTFERKYIAKSKLPRWDRSENSISDTKLHISSTGTIEDDGLGLLQVDFANCMLGGGVLGWGCVQEEIRFVICPELLVSRLFTEKLGPTEALLMIGAERFSNYKGYAYSFEWAGNYEDTTPFDLCGRRRTSIVAIDALYYSVSTTQFRPSIMIRELNKAYVGYSEDPSVSRTSVPAVATGNWGCGAFNGNVELKALLQIMACTAAKRNIVYYTFSDTKIRDSISNMHNFLSLHKVQISQLWRYLCKFNEANLSSKRLFPFIQQAHVDSLKDQKNINIKRQTPCRTLEKRDQADGRNEKNKETIPDQMDVEDVCDIEAKPIKRELTKNEQKPKETCTFISETSKKKHFNKLKSFLYSSDEEEITSEKDPPGLLQATDNFSEIDETKLDVEECNNTNMTDAATEEMEICSSDNETSEPVCEVSTPKTKEKTLSNRKISDYFKKIPK